MLISAVLIGYAAVALLLAAHAVLGLARGGRRMDATDRVILGAVALLAGAAWALLLPVYLVGWLGSARARATGARLARTGAAVRARLPLRRHARHAA